MLDRIGIAALVALPAGWWGGFIVALVAGAAAMVVIFLVDLVRFVMLPISDD